MSGLHADSERPPQALRVQESQEEEDRRHAGDAARDALRDERLGHPREDDADANLRSPATLRAWGAVFGQKEGRHSGSPGLILFLMVVVVAVVFGAIVALN